MKKIIVLPLVLGLLSIIGLAEYRLGSNSKGRFDFGDRFWIHHGGVPDNTVKGIKACLDQKFSGIEIDVHFVPSENQFYLTHDWPPAGNKISLESVLREFQSVPVKFWIDYKNSHLSHFLKAKNRLQELVRQYDFKDRLLIESPHGWHQLLLSWSGLHTSMWVRTFAKSRIRPLRQLFDRWIVGLGNFSSVSMPHEAWSTLGKTYKNFDILIFTVNESRLKEQYSEQSDIQVILMDLGGSGAGD